MHLLGLETRTEVFRSYTDTSYVKKAIVEVSYIHVRLF